LGIANWDVERRRKKAEGKTKNEKNSYLYIQNFRVVNQQNW